MASFPWAQPTISTLLIFVAPSKGKLTGFPTVSDFLIFCAKFGYFHKAVQHLKLVYPLAISLGTPVQLFV